MAWEPANVVHVVSAACAAIFLLYVPVRIQQLRKSTVKDPVSWDGDLKSVLGVILSSVLCLYLRGPFTPFCASLLVSQLASLGLILSFPLEHQRSYKPSEPITLYLLASILCDVILLTMPMSAAYYAEISRPVSLRCCMHSAILLFENFGSRAASNLVSNEKSPEELNEILSKAFFTWINPILLKGYKHVLTDHDLPPLSQDMKPEITAKAILEAWSQRVQPETKWTLPLAVLKSVKTPFLAAIVPRLFLIIFRYSQPNLIKQSIKYVSTHSVSLEPEYGYLLVVSAVFIYVGLAVSTAAYQHSLNRLRLMIRGALVGLIHHKTMESPSISYDNGEATTLMTTDADHLDILSEMIHETWAQVVEVVIGIILLAREVGWIWPLPLLLIYLCSHVSRFVARQLEPRQKGWNTATQNRVAAISSMLGSMKIVKMLGFQHHIFNRIQELRTDELHAASKLRWMTVGYNASANALGVFSPAITLPIFATISGIRGHNLNTETAFTTMAILSMVTHPANMVMTFVPRAIASLAGFDRIQTFLLRPSLQSFRSTLPDPYLVKSMQRTSVRPAILIEDLKIGNILKDVNIEIPTNSLTIISGPTGSGKSTLLRAVLGEVVPTSGSVGVSTKRIGYCAQKPWLPAGSIKEVIHGTTKQYGFDESWYREVVHMCCLKADIAALPEGDAAQVGSRGCNLSGGQRQRVALARALFAKCEIIVLDDTFCGLDGDTESAIFENLLGRNGLLRRLRATVVLVSNSTQYFQAAHHIVVLGDHGIKEQGAWQKIEIKAASIAKFSSTPQANNDHMLSSAFDKLGAQMRAKDEAAFDLARKTGDYTLYSYYFGFCGAINLFLYVACTSSYSISITISHYWLQLWTQSESGHTTFYISGFLLLSLMSWTTTNGIMWSNVIRLAPDSGRRLHYRLLNIVTNAPLSYFSHTDNGSILNRFTQDIQLIDKQLPFALSNLFVQTFKLISQLTILSLLNHHLATPLPLILLILYILQKIYLKTSRQLRFLELEARAGVLSSFLESIEGLPTLRAMSPAQPASITGPLTAAQKPEFLLLSLQRWLAIVLDLLAAALAVGVIALSVHGRVGGAQVGVALNVMLVANSTLLKLVENWTSLEISMGAIARLQSLEQLTPSESSSQPISKSIPDNWPSEGKVEFKDVCASYGGENLALQNINLHIKPGMHLTITGRTGSGKSTLLLTLLRLLELRSGTITLDGIDISHVPLDVLRERAFITISQDPLLLFNETLRFNLSSTISPVPDQVLFEALEKPGLGKHFKSDDLERKLGECKELSVGQTQLFALARALVKVSVLLEKGIKPVVLVDELASSLDAGTEEFVSGIVEREFSGRGCTVLGVAHRSSGGGGEEGNVVEMEGGRIV